MSTRLIAIVRSAFFASTAFTLAYEEPALREKFGGDYVEYGRHVRRWLPRLTPFDKARIATVPSPDLE